MWKEISIIIGRTEKKYGEAHSEVFPIHFSLVNVISSS